VGKVMKTQAWGWLAAAVLAAGLNASYHDGGLQWAHEVADRVEHSSAAVLALAGGHADQFLAEARLVSNPIASSQIASSQIAPSQIASDEIASNKTVAERDENPSCPWARAMARVQSKVAQTEANLARVQAMSDRERAIEEANFDLVQARRERMRARLVAQTDQIRATAAVFNPTVFKTTELSSHCKALRRLTLQRESLRNQTIRIDLPEIPKIDMPKIDIPKIDMPQSTSPI
jgi:hypothetical protein